MIATSNKTASKYIKSPLNYTGGKYKLLEQILPLFPQNIHTFVDLFAGGCNVAINVKAKNIICNDNIKPLIEMYKCFQNYEVSEILQYIDTQINNFKLFSGSVENYKKFREYYNKYKNALDLFVLICFSFNHQISFNDLGEFNEGFGYAKGGFRNNIRANLIQFVNKIHSINIQFTCFDFAEFDFSNLTENDFVYCDPPYLISRATYEKGYNKTKEYKLLEILDNLHQRNIKFALSNVLEHKGKENDALKNWLNKNRYLKINYIHADYSNCNYQTNRKKKTSIEVLITNYEPLKPATLFD
jgi:DNA adenine methylase